MVELNNRIVKDLAAIHYNKEYTFCSNEKNREFIYNLLIMNNRPGILNTIPPDVFRENVLSCLNFKEIPYKYTNNTNEFRQKYGINTIYILTYIENKHWLINLNLPDKYPFKPPTFGINGIAGYRIKDVEDDGPLDNYKQMLFTRLSSIYDGYFYNSWTPRHTLEGCLDQIVYGLTIHMKLGWTSRFIKLTNLNGPMI